MKSNIENSLANNSTYGNLKFLFKDSYFYGLFSAVSRGLSLFMFPFILGYLGTENYGILDFFAVISAFITQLFVFGLDGAIARLYFDSQEGEYRESIIKQVIFLHVLIIILFSPIIYFFYDFLYGNSLDIIHNQGLIELVLIKCIGDVFINAYSNLLKWQFKKYSFAIYNLMNILFTVLLLLLFAHYNLLSVKYFFQISMVSSLIFGISGLFFLFRDFKFTLEFTYIKELLIYGSPIILVSLMMTSIPVIERNLILNNLNLKTLGQYSVALKFSMGLLFIIEAFQMSWGPFSLSLFNKKGISRLFNLVFVLFSLIISLIILILFVTREEILLLISDEDFTIALNIVGPLMLVSFLKGVTYFMETNIIVNKKTYIYIIVGFIQFLIWVVLVFPLFQSFGIVGFVYSLLISSLTRFILFYWYSTRISNIKWDIKNIFYIFIYTCSFIILIDKFDISSVFFKLITLLISMFFLSLFLIKNFNVSLPTIWSKIYNRLNLILRFHGE
jgi:O-antigen/teichoic acid export membrane protein